MSDAQSRSREWRFHVRDMIEFCERVLSYTEGLDQRTFLADRRTHDATLRNIELVGEAATPVPSEIRKAHPDIPWHAIIGTRNRPAHGYLHMSDDVVWFIIQDAIPSLVPSLRALLGRTDEDSDQIAKSSG